MPMGIVTEKAAKKLPSKIATRERLGVTGGGILQGDGIPEMALNTKPPNGAELEKLAKPMDDLGETRRSQALKAFHIVCYLATGDELIFITPGR